MPAPSGVETSRSSAAAACRQSTRALAASSPLRTATRPASAKPSGATVVRGRVVQAAAMQVAAAISRHRVTGASRVAVSAPDLTARPGSDRPFARRPSLLHALYGLDEGVVRRCLRERVVPDLLRLATAPERPEHLAEMSGDLGIRPPCVGALKVVQRLLGAALPVEHPAHAVDDEGIVGCEFQRALDEIFRLVEPLVAVGERIAERVVRVRVIGLDLNQLAQARLEQIDAVEFLGEHRVVVEE